MDRDWYSLNVDKLISYLEEISDKGIEFHFNEITSNKKSLVSALSLLLVIISLTTTFFSFETTIRTAQINLGLNIEKDTDRYDEYDDNDKDELVKEIYQSYVEQFTGDKSNKFPLLTKIMIINVFIFFVTIIVFLYFKVLYKARIRAIYFVIEKRETLRNKL